MSKRNMILTVVGVIVLFAGACYAQFELDSYLRRIINLCLIYAIIGLSMNLTNGFAGQFSLGQAGFMALGAYVVGVFTVPVELRANIFVHAQILEKADVLEGAGNTHFSDIAGAFTGNFYRLTARSSVDDIALGGSVNTRNHIKGRGFAGAVGANQGHNLVLANIQIQLEHRRNATKAHGHSISF